MIPACNTKTNYSQEKHDDDVVVRDSTMPPVSWCEACFRLVSEHFRKLKTRMWEAQISGLVRYIHAKMTLVTRVGSGEHARGCHAEMGGLGWVCK